MIKIVERKNTKQMEFVLNKQMESEIIVKEYIENQNKILLMLLDNKNVDEELLNKIRRYCKIYDVDFIFACAVINHESSFKNKAYNINYKKDENGNCYVVSVDRGLCQLNSRTYYFLKREQFYDVDTNLKYGIKHMKQVLDRCNGDEYNALSIYNSGRINKNSLYAKRVLKIKQKFVDSGV
jgi:soluble lytic murein transglycosylase-like protein